jgi:hypothetical protein
MKILTIIAIVLLLTACGGKTLHTEEKRIVVMPPEGLWNCPNMPTPPAGDYSQAEVADYILMMYQSHQVCQASIVAVRAWLEEAKLITKEVEN